MKSWLNLLQAVLDHGAPRPDRTGVGTISLFGLQAEFDNSKSFPAVTAKELKFDQVKAELACFLHGFDNLSEFHALGCRIWDGNGNAPYWTPRARYEGHLGRIYGVQWRRWRSVTTTQEHGHEGGPLHLKVTDQLAGLAARLRVDPYSRRHVVTALNPGEEDQMCLPPCHVLFQCYVREGTLKGKKILDMRIDMRSVDLFLGLPFDVASYALLQRLLARDAGMLPGRLIFQLGDAHIYNNHVGAAYKVLEREPLPPPDLVLLTDTPATQFMPHHAQLVGYASHPAVKAPLNV